MFDLIALAYQADLTRVASYIMVAEGTNRTYNHIGVSDSFHPRLAPRERPGADREAREDPDVARGALRRVRRRSSPTIPDGDGTLLDHSMFLYGSNMSNSDRHNGYPLPTILVGGGTAR